MENYLYVIAQDATPKAPKKADVEATTQWMAWWQWLMVIVLLVLIGFYVVMKKKGKM